MIFILEIYLRHKRCLSFIVTKFRNSWRVDIFFNFIKCMRPTKVSNSYPNDKVIPCLLPAVYLTSIVVMLYRSSMGYHTVSLAPAWVSRVPKLGYEVKPSTRVVGSQDPYEYWGRWHSFGKTYLICIIAQLLKKCFDTTSAQCLAFCVRGRSRVAVETAGLWSGAPTTTSTTTTDVFNDTNNRKAIKPLKWEGFFLCCHLYFPLTVCYRYAVDGK